jgi:ERCC4-related helicase
MNDQGILGSLQNSGLRAWQATFVAGFLKADSPPFQLLAAPAGTGKMYSSVAIVADLVAQGVKRILVLAPTYLCDAWQQRVGAAQSQLLVFLVTRRAFREMEAAVPIGESPWAGDGVFVVSQDLAKQSDFAIGLSAVTWDLVIVDEAHRLAARQRAALLERLMRAGIIRRLLLLTATPLPALEHWLRPLPDQPTPFPTPLAVTSWFGQLRNWDGSAVERPPVDCEVVSYTRGPDEVQFLSQFITSIPMREGASGASRFLIQLLLQRAASCSFAIEQSLQRLRLTLRSAVEEVSLQIGGADVVDLDRNTDETDPIIPESTMIWADRSAGLAVVDQCLDALDAVTTDEKLNTLRRLVLSIVEMQADPSARICVFSMYADTVAYLHSALEDLAFTLFKITGAASFPDRQATVERFRLTGGILIGTDGGLSEGLEFPEVTHVIHYDLPSNPRVLAERRGRFDRFGRNTPCTMYLLRDESAVIPLESELIELATSTWKTDAAEESSPTDS